MSRSSSRIENISDTAFVVAMCRALETERPDACFQDPFARLLAGERGEVLMELSGDKLNKGLVIRTCVINELILQLISSESIDTVLNLGAGLDSRPYRLPFPSSLRWIEVDLPAILSYKEQKLKDEQPSCSLELVKHDLTNISLRKALFSRVNEEAKRVLIITEGLLGYLPTEQVAALTTDLHEQQNFQWWLCELSSPFALKQTKKKLNLFFAARNVNLQFAPEEGADFFQQYGWQTVEFRSVWEEARRLKKIQFFWFWKWLVPLVAKERWETVSKRDGIVLFERV